MMNIAIPHVTSFRIGEEVIYMPVSAYVLSIFMTASKGLGDTDGIVPQMAAKWSGDMYEGSRVLELIPLSDWHKHPEIVKQVEDLYKKVVK